MKDEVVDRKARLTAALTALEMRDKTADPNPDDAEELSAAERRMWFLHALDRASAAYVIVSARRIRGHLKFENLQGAVNWVVARHEALRTSYHDENAKPQRVVHSSVAVPVYLEDLTASTSPVREQLAEVRIRELAREPFDLTLPPLVRFNLLKLDQEDQILVIRLHHIISDGWSLALLHHELREALNALDESASLPALTPAPSYAGAIRIQEASNSSTDFLASLEWWKTRLSDLPLLELPTDHARPPVPSFQGTRHAFNVSANTTRRLEQLAKEHHTTIFTVLLSAFAAQLKMETLADDLAIGTPVANRRTTSAERAMGLFVNTVLLRLDVSGRNSFREIIDRCHPTVLNALAHQSVPFETLVDILQPERTLSHNPLFQIMFAMHDSTTVEQKIKGLEVTSIDPETGYCRFDLEVTIWRYPDTLRIRVTGSSDLFDPRTVAKFADRFAVILETITHDPDSMLDFARLGGREGDWLAQISRDELAEPDLALTVNALLVNQANRNPDRVALKTASRELTYSELDQATRSLALRLANSGVRAGEVVGLCCEREWYLVVAILAIWRNGAAVVPLAPTDPADRKTFILRDSRAKTVVCEPAWHGWIQQLGLIPIDPIDTAPQTMAVDESTIELPASSPAYLIYTSGTTGNPKGVLVSHQNVTNTLVGCRTKYAINENDQFLVLAPQNFDIFFFELLSSLISGGTAILVTRDELFNPTAIVKLLQQATAMQAVSGFLQRLIDMLEQASERCPRMRHVFTGGEAVPSTLPKRAHRAFPNAAVTSLYGPTETAMVCTGFTFPRDTPSLSYTIGRPLPNVVVRVCDPDLNLVAPGVPGELLIGGAGVSLGYLGQNVLTAERFVELNGERFYRSGDRVRWSADGQLEFLGRLDDQVKIRGFRVEPGEIQAVLESHPQVEVATVVVNSDEGDQQLNAYFVPRNNTGAPAVSVGESSRVNSWMTLFDNTHAAAADKGMHDFTGWVSVFTDERLPAAEMEDWLQGTVTQITDVMARLPERDGGPRVLEIGCGTGLLVNELAPLCSEYVASDFSEIVFCRLKSRLNDQSNVRLLHCAAHDLWTKLEGEFDLIILNSVVQYFPSAGHLARILEEGARRLRNRGALFLGDVRSLPLLEAYHYAIVGSRHPNEPADVLKQLARQQADSEEELILSPRFLNEIAKRSNVIQSCEVRPRRGMVDNELSRYRFDAILYCGTSQDRSSLNWIDWGVLGNLHELDKKLAGLDGTLAVGGIPDERLRTVLAIADRNEVSTIESLHPEVIHTMARRHALTAWIGIANSQNGTLDVVFAPREHDLSLTSWFLPKDTGPLSNIPLGFTSDLAVELDQHARERLPEYMIPTSLIEVEWLPLTQNGKVDLKALPRIPRGRVSKAPTNRPPRPGVESVIADVWKQSLRLQIVNANDGFFEVGGNSLLAIEVAVRLRAHNLAIGPQDIFRHQTVSELAQRIEALSARQDANSSSLPAKIVLSPSTVDVIVEKPRLDTVTTSEEGASECLLLTGATGFLGAHVLYALLQKHRPAKIICLVRVGNNQSPVDRLKQTMKWYFGNVPFAFGERVEVIPSDLTAPRLGMPEDVWRAAAAAQQILHIAADVRHVGDSDEIFSVNQHGTRQLLRLAGEHVPSRFHHISTIAVKGAGGLSERKNFHENDLDVGQIWTDDYSRSKFDAELAVREYADRGGITSVYRIGMIGPQWESGRFQERIGVHFFTRFLRSTISLGVAAEWHGRTFGINPVDHLAQAILALMEDTLTSEGQVFHLDTPHRLTHSRLIKFLQAYGYAIRVVPTEDYERTILQLIEQHDDIEAGGVLSLIKNPERNSLPLETGWTLSRLAALGFSFQPVDEVRFAKFLDHCVARGYLPDPALRG